MDHYPQKCFLFNKQGKYNLTSKEGVSVQQYLCFSRGMDVFYMLLCRKHHSHLLHHLLTFSFGYKFNTVLWFSETHHYKISSYESQQVTTLTSRNVWTTHTKDASSTLGTNTTQYWAKLYIVKQFGATSWQISYKRIQMHATIAAWWGIVKVKHGEWESRENARVTIHERSWCKRSMASGGKKELMRKRKRASSFGVRVGRERVRVLTQGRTEQEQRGNGGGRRAKEVY